MAWVITSFLLFIVPLMINKILWLLNVVFIDFLAGNFIGVVIKGIFIGS